ncbi:F0F1 ATP synthase subunit alpha [Stakelama tenebrarum]|uniref:ATP synthase subunit alpha n=1 Tax=Stakelama tenebrarum TaxID=2711215 RepID=A0A6G6Y1S2_9SPHN|nr:F0F1 ATP synthase subunit alpha [Sphingosinithalassobacter tenebrarum]QIG78872.1 F0F1 ATP synthase subunit alpha [Sphingosinithalassobacter tenebrarum]
MTGDRAGEWLARESDRVARAAVGPRAEALGRVEHTADTIAFVSGLPDARLGELLRFPGDCYGFVLSMEADGLNAVLLDRDSAIEAGARVHGTGDVIRVPVGPGLLGRVVDPLGRPLDGGEAVAAEDHLQIEREAPRILDRDLVDTPLETGLLVADTLFPIGRGQRELIIGDRATGKTALALDAMVNQRHSDVVCVYVAIGQRASAVERVIEDMRAHGAFDRAVFVVAAAASASGMQWIAPFAGFSIAEYFRDRGRDALIVLDDLTKHAATHREISLLTREPPGREAYPGDIFYLHARMLERAARLSPALGGGSLTALPIAETDAGNLSAYIPTNLISITDGQIVLDRRLFAAGQRPAVDVGLSVSRVGGKAQKPALRKASGRIRLDYAQFQELEMFTRFGGLSDERVKARIVRGERIRALLTQQRLSPLRMADSVALLTGLAEGLFDAIPPEAVAALRERLPKRLDAQASAAVRAIETSGELDDEARTALRDVVRSLIASPDAT